MTVDFLQYPESYYFYDGDERISLAGQLGYAVGLADQAARAAHSDVRLSASVLHTALEDLAVVLDERFVRAGLPAERVFAAYAADHGRSGRS